MPSNGDGLNLHSSASCRRLMDLLLLHSRVCTAVPVTDTGWDRFYIILTALGQLEGEGGDETESNAQKEHKQKLPKCLLLDRGQRWRCLFWEPLSIIYEHLEYNRVAEHIAIWVFCACVWLKFLQNRAKSRRETLYSWSEDMCLCNSESGTGRANSSSRCRFSESLHLGC